MPKLNKTGIELEIHVMRQCVRNMKSLGSPASRARVLEMLQEYTDEPAIPETDPRQTTIPETGDTL